MDKHEWGEALIYYGYIIAKCLIVGYFLLRWFAGE